MSDHRYLRCSSPLLPYARSLAHTLHLSHLIRYVDWSFTVSLQMVELYLILFVAIRISAGRCSFASSVAQLQDSPLATQGGHVIELIWHPSLVRADGPSFSTAIRQFQRIWHFQRASGSLATMRFIVSVGWSIHTLDA